jgi:CHAD domain-containing protein
MAYRFRLDEGLTTNARRVIHSQLGIAVKRLGAAKDPEREVHEARKAMKRTRALLRLIRPGLEPDVFARENGKLAAIGRSLSGMRDLHVLGQTVHRLALTADLEGEDAIRDLQERIEEHSRSHGRTLDVATVAQAHDELADTRKRLSKLDVQGGSHTLRLGLEASHRAARKALKHALARQQTEVLHELRKHAQHHWRHMSLLQAAWPQAMGVRVAAARELSQLLGEEHDLAALQQAISRDGQFAVSGAGAQAIAEVCAIRRAALWTMIEPRACRLFAEPSRVLAKAVSAQWRSARKHPERTPAPDPTPDGPPAVTAKQDEAPPTRH